MPDQSRHRVRPVPLWAAIGLALAAPALTWWAIGPIGRQWPDHEYGPYRVPLLLEQVAGVAAIAVAASAVLVTLLPSTRRAARRTLAPGTTVCLITAGMFGAAGWRIQTAGAAGADIGAGFVLLTGPVLIAVLLVTAVRIESGTRGRAVRHTTLLTWLAALVAPLLLAAQQGLVVYDQSLGVISAAEYATVHVDDRHAEVRDQLGRPGKEVIDWFFTTSPAGSSCDYYTGHGTTVYQICYRDSVVVTSKVSESPAGG